jgi:hypothetical protein
LRPVAAAEPQLKGSDIQFENILNLYKGAVARLDVTPYAPQLIDRLALTTANVIGKRLNDASRGVAHSLAMIHVHLLAGVTIKASNMSAADVSCWAIEQAKAQGIELKTNRQQTRSDAYHQAKGAVRSSAMGRRMIAYELDIANLEREGRIAAGSIKGIAIPDIALAVSVQKSGEHPLGAFILRQWAVSDTLVRAGIQAARFIGMFAGVLAGAYDIVFSARAAFGEQKQFLGWLYLANGALGSVIAIAAYNAIGSIFWPLLIASFLVAIAIALVNDSALKTWISHCEFGRGEKYGSFDAQLKAYRNAVGG